MSKHNQFNAWTIPASLFMILGYGTTRNYQSTSLGFEPEYKIDRKTPHRRTQPEKLQQTTPGTIDTETSANCNEASLQE
jgi:hypothetical protein